RLDTVAGQRQSPCLQQLLQSRLRILEVKALRKGGQRRGQKAQHDAAGNVEPAVQIQRPAESLQRVRQDRAALAPTALLLARAEHEPLGQAQLPGKARERLAADQVRAQARQLALVGAFEALEQVLADDQAEHRVTEELQSLVVRGTGAAMGQGTLEQREVDRGVVERLPQPGAQ